MALLGSRLLELPNKQQKIIEAVEKMQRGYNLFEEGKIEFTALCGDPHIKNVTDRVKDIAKKGRVKKAIAAKRAHKPKMFSPDEQELADSIIRHIANNPWTTKDKMRKALKRDFYRMDKVLRQLIKDKKVKLVSKINPNHQHLKTKGIPRDYYEIA